MPTYWWALPVMPRSRYCHPHLMTGKPRFGMEKGLVHHHTAQHGQSLGWSSRSLTRSDSFHQDPAVTRLYLQHSGWRYKDGDPATPRSQPGRDGFEAHLPELSRLPQAFSPPSVAAPRCEAPTAAFCCGVEDSSGFLPSSGGELGASWGPTGAATGEG